MRNTEGTVQRSLRLSRQTAELLDAAAAIEGESRNALAERLLAEGLRLENHPLVRFRAGAGGRRQPALVGSRLYVHQVIATLRDSGGEVDDAASYLQVEPRLVQAALNYYADFRQEVDQDAALAALAEKLELERWERQQSALA